MGEVGATGVLASFAAETPTATFKPQFAALRPLLVDLAATAIVGGRTEVHRRVERALKAAGQGGAIRAIGGARLTPSAAVLLDGVAIGGFEFEHVIQNAHPASTVMPALLVLATQRKTKGEDFLAAMLVGYELATRIGAASGPAVEHDRGFHNPGLNGTLASAAACSRLMGLDRRATESAMGIAASSAAGLMAFASTGAMTKRLHPGRAAQLGLESAWLAASGVDGPPGILERPDGFLRAFSPHPGPAALTEGLGENFTSLRQTVKLAPAHAYAQPFIEAIDAARESGVDLSGASSVRIRAVPAALEPHRQERAPTSLLAAQYSVPYCIAVALARDLRNPLAFDESVLTDARIRSIAQAIEMRAAPSPDEASIELQLGGDLKSIPAAAYEGRMGAPGFDAAVKDKLIRCLAAVGRSKDAPSILQAVDNLPSATSLTAFRDRLVGA